MTVKTSDVVTVGIPTYNRPGYLREAIESVLSQTFAEFRLIIADNASGPETRDVVDQFADARIDYFRSEQNIGLVANQNRILELAATDLLLILPDDDLLYPDHLRMTVEVMRGNPQAGFVHTAFDIVDADSRPTERNRMLLDTDDDVSLEAGFDFLRRSMRSSWTACWPSILFRAEAIRGAGGQRVDDTPMPDFPLLMRIARSWDVAFLRQALAATRFHTESATAAVGSAGSSGYEFGLEHARTLHRHRTRFIEEGGLAAQRLDELGREANATWVRDQVRSLADAAASGAAWWAVSRSLLRLVRNEPKVVLLRATWRLVAAQLGGRAARTAVRGMRA